MIRRLCVIAVMAVLPGTALAQTMTINTAARQYIVTNTFSNVSNFAISIVINAPLAPGVYINPDIISVTYQVTGVLAPGSPSGFTAFDLQRTMDGTEFYAQGSSLSFEISQDAVLVDGVQVGELAGNDVLFTFNGREIDNGRFHPALLELRADGTGRIQNSNNIPSIALNNELQFGEEYITDLTFVPGNTTIITSVGQNSGGGGGGGSAALIEIATLFALLTVLRFCRRRIGIAAWRG